MADKNDGSVIIKVDLNLDDFNKTEKESEKLASNLTKNFSKAGTAVANGIKAAFDVTLKAIAATSAAVTAAMSRFNKELLNTHIRDCVSRDIREGQDDVIDELLDILHKLMR